MHGYEVQAVWPVVDEIKRLFVTKKCCKVHYSTTRQQATTYRKIMRGRNQLLRSVQIKDLWLYTNRKTTRYFIYLSPWIILLLTWPEIAQKPGGSGYSSSLRQTPSSNHYTMQHLPSHRVTRGGYTGLRPRPQGHPRPLKMASKIGQTVRYRRFLKFGVPMVVS